MSQHVCHVEGCSEKTSRRALMCGKHWKQLPEVLRKLCRPRNGWDGKADKQTLRCHPEKLWLETVADKFGMRVRVAPYEQIARRVNA